MKLITKRDKIRGVADRWRRTYEHGWNSRSWQASLRDKKEIWTKLCSLDVETATEADVAAIIGNDSWTQLECHNCSKSVTQVVSFNGCAADEYGQTRLCFDCVAWAREVFES